MVEGARGIGVAQHDPNDEVEDYSAYGVDWEFLNDGIGGDIEDLAPPHHPQAPRAGLLGYGEPEVFNEVICEPPSCLLSQDELAALSLFLNPLLAGWMAQLEGLDNMVTIMDI
jgi:hypothetical protein